MVFMNLEKISADGQIGVSNDGDIQALVNEIRYGKDEENFKKADAMIQLMCELSTGIRSAEEEGWISSEDFHKHFANRRNENQ
jgi:hypothetical protein